jgi:hypothetical protein
MLCALTTPSPDERTDFGAIDPFMVCINFMDEEITSPCAGYSELSNKRAMRDVKSRVRTVERYWPGAESV